MNPNIIFLITLLQNPILAKEYGKETAGENSGQKLLVITDPVYSYFDGSWACTPAEVIDPFNDNVVCESFKKPCYFGPVGGVIHNDFPLVCGCSDNPYTTGKNNLFRKSNTQDNELHHENGCIKSSSQLQGEHCKCSSDFFPSECPGLCST